MEKRILERYARTGDGRLAVDVAAARIEDLYSCYDRSAPYLKKDLEPELVDYLVECARELGGESFVLRFSLDSAIDTEGAARLKESVKRYFLYLKHLEFRELKNMFRTSLILLAVGIGILTLSVWLNRQIEVHETVVGRVFAEGLTVAAWVSLWEALATFLINWAPHRRRIRLYERIAGAPLLFGAAGPATTPSSDDDDSLLPGR
jgi:hypothetical protein